MRLKKNDNLYPAVRNIGVLVTIPMVFAAGPLVGFFIGSWIDNKWGFDPWGKTALVLLGFIASVKQVIEFLKSATKETDSK